jgi:hypothetical protein
MLSHVREMGRATTGGFLCGNEPRRRLSYLKYDRNCVNFTNYEKNRENVRYEE